MFKIGKKGREWAQARSNLKEVYLEKGITSCELGLVGCWGDNALGFAHRYKRNDPRCENTFGGTLLACNPCHHKIEYDRELSEKMFQLLR